MRKLGGALIFLFIYLFQEGICYGADIRGIINFIVKHNTEISEMKKLKGSLLSDIKIEAYTNASTLSQEIGLKVSMPLFSPSEKREKKIETLNKERTVISDALKLVGLYFSEMRFIEHEEKLLISFYNELQWIGKRVEAGIDNQKEYNTKLHAYIERRRDIEARKAGAEAMIESILAFVPDENRPELRRMINESVSENKKAEKQNLSLSQEGKQR